MKESKKKNKIYLLWYDENGHTDDTQHNYDYFQVLWGFILVFYSKNKKRIFNDLTFDMEFISRLRQDFAIFSLVRDRSEKIKKFSLTRWITPDFYIKRLKIEFSIFHYIFLGYWHVSFTFWTLHAIYDVTSFSLVIFTLW